MKDTPLGLVRKCDENAHESWKSLIDNYEVADENQDSLNEVTNMWNNCRIKDTSKIPDIWFNELYKLSLNVHSSSRRSKQSMEKIKTKLKAHFLTSYLNNTNQSEYPKMSILK